MVQVHVSIALMQVQLLLSAPSSSQTTLVCDDISFFVEKSPPTSFRCSSSPQNARRFGVPHVLDLIGLFVFSILFPAILPIICITPQAFLNRPAALFYQIAIGGLIQLSDIRFPLLSNNFKWLVKSALRLIVI